MKAGKKKTWIIISVVAVILTIGILYLISGGSSSKQYFRQDSLSLGVDALAVADDFLNRDITSSEATKELEKIHSKIESLEFSSSEESEDTWNTLLALDVSTLKLNISMYDSQFSTVTRDDIQKSRNDIAEMIGEKKLR